MYLTVVNIKKFKKLQIFFHINLFRNCIPSSVYMCVKDTCWKSGIYYKFTIKESLKLTKGIIWWLLKLEKIKFANTLKANMQLWDKINGTKGPKQLQNNQANIKHKTASLSQLINRGRRYRSNKKNLFSPHCCLAKVN